MSRAPDPYAVLGVAADASSAEINRAYRALLLRHHPDTRTVVDAARHAYDDTMLQQVLDAYAVLGDPARRAAYDRRRHDRRPAPAPAAPDRSRRSTHRPPIVAGPVRWHSQRP